MPSGKASKRLRQELMANQIQKQNMTPVLVEKGEIHSGPIPDPETLEKYKNADPSFPERIMKMAEDHNSADVLAKRRISFTNMIVPILGQAFTVALAISGTIACIYLALKGFSWPAVASITAAYAPIIIGAFRNLRGK